MKVLNSLRTAKERHPDCQIDCEAKRTAVCDL